MDTYPPNVVDITFKEFSRSLTTWGGTMTFAQVQRPGTYAMNTQLFTRADGRGLAIEAEGRTYKFAACEHTNESVKLANCYFQMTCTQCGYVENVDSSG